VFHRHSAGTARGAKGVAWHGDEDVLVETVGDPALAKPTDAIVRRA
jgi:hypothetical protein